MAKRQTRRHTPAADLGPSVRLERGEVAVELAPDPDAPQRTIRRARVQWAPDVLLAAGTIRQPQHDAAVRLLTAYEVGILGARDRPWLHTVRAGAPAGPTDAMLAAATDYRQAMQAVGIRLAAPLAACVLGRDSLRALAARLRVSPHAATGYLVAALDRLADHYGY